MKVMSTRMIRIREHRTVARCGWVRCPSRAPGMTTNKQKEPASILGNLLLQEREA